MSFAQNDMLIRLSQINSEAALRQNEFIGQLTEYINYLIQTNFSALVQVLYRIDVHEEKLKYLLQRHSGENAAEIIAGLMIERQLQKIKSKELFKQTDATDEAEKW